MSHPKFYLMDGVDEFGPPRKFDNPNCLSLKNEDTHIHTWVEVVFFDPVRREIHLLKDITSGMDEVWFLHGTFTSGIRPSSAAMDAMRKRICTSFAPHKLQPLTVNEYFFPAKLSEAKQCIHALSFVFAYAIDVVEMVSMLPHLNRDYIDRAVGVHTLKRDDLVLGRMSQVLVDTYDLLFP